MDNNNNNNNFKRVSLMVLTDVSGKALICHRRADHYRRPNMWDLPGGKSEPGESPLETAVRETSEEVGFMADPKSCEDLGGIKSAFPDAVMRTYQVYTTKVDPNWQPSSPSGDFDDFRWLSKRSELEGLALPPADVWALKQVLDD